MKKKITLETIHDLVLKQGEQINTKIDNLDATACNLALSTAREFAAVRGEIADVKGVMATKDDLERTKEELIAQINCR